MKNYTAADWGAALDDTRPYQFPPILETHGDSIPYPPLAADLPRPALRPWQRWALTVSVVHIIGSIVIHSMATAQGANAVTALVVVAIALAAQLIADAIILAIAGRMGRL